MSLSVSVRPLSNAFWQQIWALTVANLKSRYRNTIAGFVWVVMNPIIMFAAQSYAFKHVLKLQITNYSLFLLSALVPWIFVTQSLEMCTSLFVTSGRLLKSFPLHPVSFLLAQLADNAINFVAVFALILTPVAMTSSTKTWALLLLPLPILVLVVAVLGLAWFLATLQVFFRDTRFLVSFGLSVAFFLTPVFYPEDFVPPKFRALVVFNPLYRLLLPFRVVIYDFQTRAFVVSMLYAALVAAGLLGLAYFYWRRKRNAVYLNL